jgi:uncharacterized protein
VIVDAYSHVCPERLLDAISERHPSTEVAALRKNSYLFDGERRLRYMDRIGVDQQVLVLVRPPMWLGMSRPLVHELTRVANESIAEMAAAWPDRFIPVGVLPVVDDEMMAEYHRLTTDLGICGVLIFSNIEGLPLDDDSMWPLYAAAAGDDVPIWIHPQHGHSYPWLKKDLRIMYGTDFPMGSNNGEDWPVEVLDTIRSLGLSAADQELLLGANLHRIMRL